MAWCEIKQDNMFASWGWSRKNRLNHSLHRSLVGLCGRLDARVLAHKHGHRAGRTLHRIVRGHNMCHLGVRRIHGWDPPMQRCIQAWLVGWVRIGRLRIDQVGGVASGVRHVNSVSRSAAGALVGARVGESSSGGDRESLEAWPTSECSGVLVVADREVTVGAAAAVRPCPVAVSAGVASPVWLVAKEVVQATPVGWPTPRLRIISVKLKRRVVLWGRNFRGRERATLGGTSGGV